MKSTCLLLTFGLSLVVLTSGTGVIDIRFMSYEDDCEEFVHDEECDPMFTFCVNRPDLDDSVLNSKCWYEATSESGHFHDTDYINFDKLSIIKGLENPWEIIFDELKDDSIKLVWRVQNSNPIVLGGTTHLITAKIVMKNKVWPNESVAKYMSYTSTKSDHILRFNIRIYCTNDFYGPYCNVSCAPPSSSQHYYCDPDTGVKKCQEGWEGPDCNTNVDECQAGRCVHGQCSDTIGSFTCTCDPGYTGRGCDSQIDPCDEEPCDNNGKCTSNPSLDPTKYSCQCVYPYVGTNCQTVSSTTTTTTGTTDSTQPSDGPPVVAASKSQSAGFEWWIALVIGIALFLLIGSIIMFIFCRRRRRQIKRKDSARTLVPNQLSYDGSTLAFDNNAYSQVNANNAEEERRRREGLPPLSAGGQLTNGQPTFQAGPDDDSDEMDDDGYLKAKPSVKGDDPYGLTASGRRAKSNDYSNFNQLGRGSRSRKYDGTDEDFADENHYHDLDEAAMDAKGRRKRRLPDIPRPIAPEEEGAYTDLPRNTPSQRKGAHSYDNIDDPKELPKEPNRDSRPYSLEKNSKKGFYPEMPNDRLRTSDPFASPIHEDEDENVPNLENRVKSRKGEYETPTLGGGTGGPINKGEGGYETPNGLGDGAKKRPKETGGYEVPSRTAAEYAKTPLVPPKPVKTSTFHVTAGPTYSNQSFRGESEMAFPPPPPPLTSEEIAEAEAETQFGRDTSFHYGQTQNDGENKNSSSGGKRLENGGFMNPTFGGDGPSNGDNTTDTTDSSSSKTRPISFLSGRTENTEHATETQRRDNDGFLNPLFGDQNPSNHDKPGDQQVPADDADSKSTPQPGAPLYMKNLMFEMET